MTDHGSFVVFNVYVPASCGMPLSYKMKFLNALRRCMVAQRELGKKVILVGDLNISHQGIDVHWRFRSVRVNAIIQECRDNENSTSLLPKWKLQLAQHWDTIQTTLSTLEAIPVTTKNIANGSTFDKFRARVTIGKPGSERKILLGAHESAPGDCLARFTFPRVTYLDQDLNNHECVAREANVILLDTLAELMAKIVKVDWDISILRVIANSEGAKKSSPTSNWLNCVLKDDGMVDAFRHLFSDCQGRFTCWNQHTNRRFENEGSRIDYTIVDAALVDYIDNDGSQRLRCCNYPDAETKFGSEEAGLHAAIASGQFQGAAFSGGGIASATRHALETQFGSAHTGIIYTAPQYSDHVPVSLLLNERFDETMMSTSLILNGKETKQAQPHKAQKSIASFFAAPSNRASSSSSSASSTSKRKAVSDTKTSDKKKGTIMSHFGKKK